MVVLTEQLVLSKTRLPSLLEVRNLNLWGQDLSDVSIISKMTNVEVLSLSVNKISSLSDFAGCPKLQELYLRKNEVADVREVQHLAGLKQLKVLWLSDNPCAEVPEYRARVVARLPRLQKLDNADISDADRLAAQGAPSQANYGPAMLTFAPHSANLSQHGAPGDGDKPSVDLAQVQRFRVGAAPLPAPKIPGEMHPPAPAARADPNRPRPNLLYAVMVLVDEMAQAGDNESLTLIHKEIASRLQNLRK